jgi:hypothetical protein
VIELDASRVIDPDLSARLHAAGTAAVRTTMAAWAGDRRGLGRRLASDAFARYGFTHRSPGYERRVAKSWGTVLPYVSPKKTGYTTFKFLHGLTKPNLGHRVAAVTSGVEVYVPAARGLNFSKDGGTYLREWQRLYPIEIQELDARLDEATADAGQRVLQGA